MLFSCCGFLSRCDFCLFHCIRTSLLNADTFTQISWSCRADASKAPLQDYFHIRDVLANIADDPDEMPKVRCEANGLMSACVRWIYTQSSGTIF